MRYRDLTESVNERDIIDGILKAVPEAIEIWFHGSRARGDHKPKSDWDYLVVVPSLTVERRVELGQAGSALHRIHPRADIQAVTPDEATSAVSPLYWAKTEGEGRMIWPNLTEAPIADFQYIDRSEEPWHEGGKDRGPTGSSFRDDDQKALKSLKWRGKLIHTFRNTIAPINFYALNAKFLRTYSQGTEMVAIPSFLSDMAVWTGNYEPEDFHKTFGFLPDNIQQSITFVLAQNEGDERVPLTPWMVGHRMVHALLNDNQHYSRQKTAYRYTLTKAFERAREMMNQIRDTYPDNDIRYGSKDKEMFAQISTLASARNGKIERPGEFLIELMTQFFLTGDFKIDLSALTMTPSQEEEILHYQKKAKEFMAQGLREAVGALIVF